MKINLKSMSEASALLPEYEKGDSRVTLYFCYIFCYDCDAGYESDLKTTT